MAGSNPFSDLIPSNSVQNALRDASAEPLVGTVVDAANNAVPELAAPDPLGQRETRYRLSIPGTAVFGKDSAPAPLSGASVPPVENRFSDPQQYAEAVKQIVPGAVSFGGSMLQSPDVLVARAQQGAAKFGADQLAIMDRIDRGETVRGVDDAYDYQNMSPEQKAKARADLEAAQRAFNPTPVQDRTLFKAGEAVQDYAKTLFPPAPGYETSFGADFGRGLGSLATGMGLSLFAGPWVAGAAFAGAGVGEATQRAVEFDRKEKAAGRPGITQDQITTAGLLGIGPGTTDLLPVEVLLGRLPVRIPEYLRRPMAQAISRVGIQAVIEGVQEGGQGFLQDLIAREIYNPQQVLGENFQREAEVGAAVGGFAELVKQFSTGMVRSAAGRRGGTSSQPTQAPQEPAQRQEPELVLPDLPRPETPPAAQETAVPATPQDAAPGGSQANPFSDLIPANTNTPIADAPWVAELADSMTARREVGTPRGESSEILAAIQASPSTLEREARELLRDAQRYERDLRASGATPEQIAQEFTKFYGAPVSAQDIETGNTWWARIPGEVIESNVVDRSNVDFGLEPKYMEALIAKNPLVEGESAPIDLSAKPQEPQRVRGTQGGSAPGPRLTSEMREVVTSLVKRGLGSQSIASELRKQFGQYVRTDLVDAVIEQLRGKEADSFRRERAAQAKVDQYNRLAEYNRRPEVRAAASARMKAVLARPEMQEWLRENGRRVGQMRAREESPFTPGMEARLASPEYKKMTAKQATKALRKEFGEQAARITPYSVQNKRIANPELRTSSGPGTPKGFQWSIRDDGRNPDQRLAELMTEAPNAAVRAEILNREFGGPGIPTLTPKAVSKRWDKIKDSVLRAQGDEPMFAAGAWDPRTWLDWIRDNPDVGRERTEAERSDADRAGRQAASEQPGTGAAGKGSDGSFDARGQYRVDPTFTVQGFAGRIIPTAPNAQGLGRAHVFLHPPKVTWPFVANPVTTLRNLDHAGPIWMAKAEVTEVEPGVWSVKSFNVKKAYVPKGLGIEFLDAIQQQLGGEIVAPGAMTPQMYEIWNSWERQGSTFANASTSISEYVEHKGKYYSPNALRVMQRKTAILANGSAKAEDRNKYRREFNELSDLVDKLPPDDDILAAIQGPPANEGASSGLDMSPEARMERARQMGFDTGTVWYHSQLQPKDKFEPHGKFMGKWGVSGISLTDNPDMASRYLDRYGEYGWVDGKPNQPFQKAVGAYYVRGNFKEISKPIAQNLGLGFPLPENYRWPKELDGYDGVIVRDAINAPGKPKGSDGELLADLGFDDLSDSVMHTRLDDPGAIVGRELILRDPKNIRSVNAAFDPAQEASADLMAAVNGAPSNLRSAAFKGVTLFKRPVVIPQNVVDGVRRAIEPLMPIVPQNTNVGIMTRIAPVKNGGKNVNAEMTFETANGDTFGIRGDAVQLLGMRALYDPRTNSIGLIRFDLSGDVGQMLSRIDRGEVTDVGLGDGRGAKMAPPSLLGEIAHEVVHVIRRRGIIDDAVWSRLVAHGNSLRVLDSEYRTLLQRIGNANYTTMSPGVTGRELYRQTYAGEAPALLRERIDQESVAHMLELYVANELFPQEVEPVRLILDSILDGSIWRGGQGEGGEAQEGVGAEAMAAIASEDRKRNPKLDMGIEARMARARDLGFDTSTRWFHGANRSDRIAKSGKFDPKRATSGPMAFFTNDPQVASNYATGKGDTSMPDDISIAQYFTVSPKDVGLSGRSPITVEQSWYYLSPEQRKTILERAKRVGYEDQDTGDGSIVLHPEGVDASISGSQFDYYMKTSARGNPLSALRELWHDSGAIFGQEHMMAEIWKLAGYPHRISEENAPWTENPGVIPVFLRMRNPLEAMDYQNLTANVIPALESALKNDRTRKAEFGADGWDKNSRYTPKEWVQQLKGDVAEGRVSYVWTSIPDKVSDVLKRLGYDGIIDRGNKGGNPIAGNNTFVPGEDHTVAIPFYARNVRSVMAAFDPKNYDKDNLLAATQRQRLRDQDSLGYYSQALEAARGLKQAKGTPEQMLAQLKSAGVKDAEIEATGLRQFLDSKKPSLTEITQHISRHVGKMAETIKEELQKPTARLSRKNARGLTVLLTKSPDGAGDFRITRFQDGEPIGHSDFKADERSIRTAAQEMAGPAGEPPVSVTRDEIVSHLEGNRVRLQQSTYRKDPVTPSARAAINNPVADPMGWARGQIALRLVGTSIDQLRQARSATLQEIEAQIAELRPSGVSRFFNRNAAGDAQRLQALQEARELVQSGQADPPLPTASESAGAAKWSTYSLDPSNPSYRETVLHLPAGALNRETPEWKAFVQEMRAKYGDDWWTQLDDAESQRRFEASKGNEETPDFRQHHFKDEPNVVGHMMTSMVKHEGQPTYLIDQIQSDWGQKLRDGGVRDEAKIADLQAAFDAAFRRRAGIESDISSLVVENRNLIEPVVGPTSPWGTSMGISETGSAMWEGRHLVNGVTETPIKVGSWNGSVDYWPVSYNWKGEPGPAVYKVRTENGKVQNGTAPTFESALAIVEAAHNGRSMGELVLDLADLAEEAGNTNLAQKLSALSSDYTNARNSEQLTSAELQTAKAATPGNPLVNTTDQWVNTTLRRALRQAAEADASYIAIPHGDTVLSYNPEGPSGPNGMREFYGRSLKEGIVTKNLRKLIEKLDRDAPKPVRVEKVEAPTKGMTNRGDLKISDGGTDFGFTIFPLTDKVKQEVLDEGQPLFAFGGMRAAERLASQGETRPLQMLKALDEMEDAGASKHEIWAATAKIGEGSPYTGAMRGPDGLGRFEIDDSNARYTAGDDRVTNFLRRRGGGQEQVPAYPTGTLGAGIKHDELYRAYPDMPGMSLFSDGNDLESGGVAGVYDQGNPNKPWHKEGIGISEFAPNKLSTGLHEMQHAIQQREGFAKGSSPDLFSTDAIKQERWEILSEQIARLMDDDPAGAKAFRKLNQFEVRNKGKQWTDEMSNEANELESRLLATKNGGAIAELDWQRKVDDTQPPEYWRDQAMQLYRSHAGEAEARLVQARRKMTDAERRSRPAYENFDVPENQQIVRFGTSNPQRAIGTIQSPGANINSFATAVIMTKRGASPKEIWDATGWFKDPETGQWLTETKNKSDIKTVAGAKQHKDREGMSDRERQENPPWEENKKVVRLSGGKVELPSRDTSMLDRALDIVRSTKRVQ